MHVGKSTHAFPPPLLAKWNYLLEPSSFGFFLLQTFITTCHISATFQKSVAEPWEQLNVLWCRACKIYTFQHFSQCTGRSSKWKSWRSWVPFGTGTTASHWGGCFCTGWGYSTSWSNAGAVWTVKRESATHFDLQRLTWAKLACLFYFWGRKKNQTLIHAFLTFHTYPKSVLNL